MSQSYLLDMKARVDTLKRDADGNLTTESFTILAEGNQAIFSVIFNGMFTSVIGGQLQSSNKDGCAQIRKDMAAIGAGAETIVGLVKHQIAALGVEECGKPGVRNATKSFLWLARELNFICSLLRLLVGGMESSKAGVEAYETALVKYHPYALQKVVKTAVGYVPKIGKILEIMKLSEEEGFKQVNALVPALDKVIEEVMGILEKENANFQGYA